MKLSWSTNIKMLLSIKYVTRKSKCKHIKYILKNYQIIETMIINIKIMIQDV